ncbi:polyunsaturated fatty acid 5-lipoxygenase-like [Chiloscyllium plagiosum]|uniref:polyunsaturated fatty acid 5-lipoxygenase-like n=1 Tax=Chiloscyllium plagiosum TaxID=36176 RepID=UPI001CB84208|nr:polyunsaturated fatty acid 5-lipoxygenase-like [Chiloscyllium plagiosum]
MTSSEERYNSSKLNQVDSYDMTVTNDIGEILLVKIEKRKYWVQDDWYCKYITVKTPNGDYMEFPCYRWITDHKEIELRDGHGVFDPGNHIICESSKRVEVSKGHEPKLIQGSKARGNSES